MSTNSLRPLTLHAHSTGPNPYKVAILLQALDIAYTVKLWDFSSSSSGVKGSNFTAINPNGRVPAITDPNNDNITLWESGAIIEYLLATYDPSNSLTYTSSPNKFLTQSWLHFQTSGQGPYFGQRAWFTFYAEEKPQSVLDRYGAEIWRVTGVIDATLKKSGGEWLVGDKCSYADLSFVPWYWLCPAIMGEGFNKEWESKYPTSWAWYQRMQARSAVKKAREDREKAMAK